MATKGIKHLIKPNLANITSYDPVDPPEELAKRAGIPADRVIKLNGNENPNPPHPAVRDAVAKTPFNIYPDPLQRKVRAALAQYTGVDADHIIAGAGSDELIDLLFRLFIQPGDTVLDFDPTFGMYAFCARLAEAKMKLVPRNEIFDIDIDAVKKAIDSRSKIIFVSSPNNPTGNLASEEHVRALLDTGLVVVVDEAYFEFCKQSAAVMVPEYDNLVVLRTMSKWAGLAGLRVGYGIMSPSLVQHIIDIKSPYNLNIAAEAGLLASIEHAPELQKHVDTIVTERERMVSLLKRLPGVKPWPSAGNFVLAQFAPGKAQGVFDGLAKRGIFVRKFGSERLRDCFRISVGTSAQTDGLIAAMKELV
ncbi:MAG: histidinol-phosphate transaminase [SAR202 cluster bacterium]|nr:histidinol-phosphate transaminase [SAR202 cluster bacterium]